MSTTYVKYATSANFTITLASLASSATAGRESTAIDNTSNKYIDAILQFHFKLQAGTPANDKAIYIFLYGSEDGTNYTDNVTGSNAAITMRSPTNLIPCAAVLCPDAGALTYKSGPIYIAQFFGGGFLPRKWGVVIRNYTGVTLSATEGDHAYRYTGINREDA